MISLDVWIEDFQRANFGGITFFLRVFNRYKLMNPMIVILNIIG